MNKKFLTTLHDIFGKLVVLVLIFLGVFQDIWVAKNLLYFLNFLVTLLGVFVFVCKNDAIKLFEENKKSTYFDKIPLNSIYYWIVILSYASMGWFISSFIWFLTWAGIQSLKKDLEK